MSRPSWLCGLAALGSAFAVAGAARAEQSETTTTTSTASNTPADANPPPNGWQLGPGSREVVLPPKFLLMLGLQAFAVTNKVMAGAAGRTGKYWGPRFEVSLLGTIDPVADLGPFLGNQFGLYIEGTPLRWQRFDLSAGLGTDIYLLWGINSDLAEFTLAAEANANYWVTQVIGVSLGVRGYPLHTAGIAPGERRDGSAGNPVLISAGVSWRSE